MNGMVRRDPPQEMRRWKQWVLWGRKDDTKHPPKTPYQATGYPASPTNPLHWSKYDDVMYEYVMYGKYHGIGFVFSENDGLVGIDLDKVIDEQGNLDNKAKEIVERFNTYVEKSPSGRGLHIICKGKLPKGGKKGNVEMYSWGRYFTYTGDVLKDLEVNECQEAIDWLFDKYIKSKDNQPTIEDVAQTIPTLPNLETDPFLLKKMFDSEHGEKIKKLYEGDWEGLGYPSQSEADQAFCNHLAFYTRKDKAKMDAIFRESRLIRKKWDEKHGEKTYGEMTLDKAIAGTGAGYGEKKEDKKTPQIDILNAEYIETQRTNFLYYPYIPRGAITMIAGDPGVGKTWFAMELVRVMSNGANFNSCGMYMNQYVEECVCLYISGDDDIARTLKPRAERCGVKLCNLNFIEHDLSVTFDSDILLGAIKQTGARFIVLDPLQAFMTGDTDINKANAVRSMLTPLKQLAEKENISIIILAHHGKMQNQKIQHKTLGSVDFIGLARSLLTVERIKIGEEEKIIIGHTKANLSKRGDTIIGHISDNGFVFDEFTSKTIDEILYPDKKEREKGAPALDEAVDFLLEFLADGPKMKSEIIKEMYDRGIGISNQTIKNAGAVIGVNVERTKSFPAKTIWSLPQKEEIEEVEEPP